jgi:putative acetyltransferase
VVPGGPGYYGRFGFRARDGLLLLGVPAEYFQALPFDGSSPWGEVRLHAGFGAKG